MTDSRPLVIHVVFSFDVGGLENGIVNLLNHMPAEHFRHMIVALTHCVPSFCERVRRHDVEFVSLHKPAGHGVKLYPALFRMFRDERPAIVHTRNLAALEMVVPAWLAGVKGRIHGEHGRDVGDYDGKNKKYQWIRRLYSPFVKHYIALSRDLADYLTHTIGITGHRVAQIYNGVDATRFQPANSRQPIPGSPFHGAHDWLVGTAGRMQTVKDQTNLAQAFVLAIQQAPRLRSRLRLIMVGDGPLRAASQAILDKAGMADLAWLPGERQDVPDVMRGLDCFVLPSIAEGVSNTILEAMASGLPVIATAVGGNPELVVEGESGLLVPPSNPIELAAALIELADDPERARAMGKHGRQLVESNYSMGAMVRHYQQLYDRLFYGKMRQQPNDH